MGVRNGTRKIVMVGKPINPYDIDFPSTVVPLEGAPRAIELECSEEEYELHVSPGALLLVEATDMYWDSIRSDEALRVWKLIVDDEVDHEN